MLGLATLNPPLARNSGFHSHLMNKALITGITGQDGSISPISARKGYEVHASSAARAHSTRIASTTCIKTRTHGVKLFLHYALGGLCKPRQIDLPA
jgi:GDP-D-mannose dehydratase